jgi:hypothetical protein
VAHPRHEDVRRLYGHRCGYCGVGEVEAGGELTVDHHHPVSAGGDDAADNLVYCCPRCNGYKHDFVPNADDLKHGRRILHPLRDPIAAHLRLNAATGRLEPLTPTGIFHIELLRLNRPQLVEHRLAVRLRELLEESNRLLRQENTALRQRVELLSAFLSEFKEPDA